MQIIQLLVLLVSRTEESTCFQNVDIRFWRKIRIISLNKYLRIHFIHLIAGEDRLTLRAGKNRVIKVSLPSIKKLQITNAGEPVEKKGTSYMVGGNVNWCSHYEE